MEEPKDKFVPLRSPEGVIVQVWDFANHVENLLSQGWSRPEKPAAKVAKTEKEP